MTDFWSFCNSSFLIAFDRVLLRYLNRSYNVKFSNQMLMSTALPFAYYQPYVWDSSQVMPPGIFMGRKEQLEKIKSATGVKLGKTNKLIGSTLVRENNS